MQENGGDTTKTPKAGEFNIKDKVNEVVKPIEGKLELNKEEKEMMKDGETDEKKEESGEGDEKKEE